MPLVLLRQPSKAFNQRDKIPGESVSVSLTMSNVVTFVWHDNNHDDSAKSTLSHFLLVLVSMHTKRRLDIRAIYHLHPKGIGYKSSVETTLES